VCGITGIAGKESIHPNAIAAMTQRLSHRGPDAHGIYAVADGTIALGHTRLSIIDLRTISNQPFQSSNGRYVLVFNGEIYNFKAIREDLIKHHGKSFKTDSDTEVIIEAFSVWGDACVTKLEGMFAFVIVDVETKKLYLFRDRVGKKPLYYFHSNDLFAFASEIKALLTNPDISTQLTINQDCISTFLHLGYIPQPATIYQQIHKFPAGHVGLVDSNLAFSVKPYWKVEEHYPLKKISDFSDAKNQLNNLLHHAVGERLMSDVPLGAFLSGGTDSSLVCAIASKQMQSPLKTFSIGFENSRHDERHYASSVAKHLGTDHTEYVLNEREGCDILQQYLHHYDEPFADTSAIPTMLISRLARDQVTVVLTGDGGDELFLGYGAYVWANRLNAPMLKVIQRPLGKILERSGNNRLERVSKLLQPNDQSGIRSHIFSQEQYFFSQDEIAHKLLATKTQFHPFVYEDPAIIAKISPAEKQALFDFNYYLKDDLLVKVDRASMYHSLECRCPLLDRRIVEFACALDPSLKLKNKKSKYILKSVLKDYLPESMVERPKWGFSVPLDTWLKNDLRYLIDEHLSEKRINEIGLFNPGYVLDLTQKFFAGTDYLYNRLWVLIVIQKWMKEHAKALER
jgi:asparagine synthase (glutamine-hydrolysing)